MSDQVEVFSDIPCELGEGAIWDASRSRVYWVDIRGRMIYARDWSGGETLRLPAGDMVSSVVPRAGGGVLAALRHAIAFCDIDLGTIEAVRTIEDEVTGTRLNDGAVDPAGRYWVGSMDLGESAPTGSFYRVDPDLTVTRAFGGIIISNGPAWSPDGRTIYHVDTQKQLISAYEYDPDSGEIGEGRVFVSDQDRSWYPDGVTVDAEGFVWNPKWGGGRIVRYAPDGSVDRELMLPVPRPTRCAFVGPDLALMVVTSALGGAVEAPLSGQVLLVDPGARGLPDRPFEG